MNNLNRQGWWVALSLALLLLGLNLFGGITQIVCVVLSLIVLLGVVRKIGSSSRSTSQ